MGIGVLFPGQGAQFPGMGRDWCEAFPLAREMFERADALLGFALTDACWNQGDRVHRTDIAQPGIFTTSAAIVSVLESRGLERHSAAMAAGLSLGEYTALWFADSLSFEDGLRLVRLRGEAMQAASEQIPSSMLSLVGATLEQAEALAAEGARRGICQVANLNAPGQIVLSGELGALQAAEARAKDHGVRRTRRLTVAGGFHSECMRPAAQRLETALREIEIRRPAIPFATNVTGGPVSDPGVLRAHLARQVCASVRWEQSMRWALSQGITEYLEPGPGNVLGGLLSKIEPLARVRSLARVEDLSPA
jgi:[acyl-carrier-protein] S-malonyltransferase